MSEVSAYRRDAIGSVFLAVFVAIGSFGQPSAAVQKKKPPKEEAGREEATKADKQDIDDLDYLDSFASKLNSKLANVGVKESEKLPVCTKELEKAKKACEASPKK